MIFFLQEEVAVPMQPLHLVDLVRLRSTSATPLRTGSHLLGAAAPQSASGHDRQRFA
jgi:hypothetical protein